MIVADIEFTKLWNKTYNTSYDIIQRELYIIPTNNNNYIFKLY